MKWSGLHQILLPSLAGIFVSLTLEAQEHRFVNYNEQNGLPSSETYHMIQDRAGFIWIASDNGVVRFDGEDFQHYSIRSGLIDNTIFGFFEDDTGRIWSRSYSGALGYFEEGKFFPYPYNHIFKDSLHGGLVNGLYVTGDTLWFSTIGRTLAGFIDRKGKVTNLEQPFREEGAYLYLFTLENNRGLVGINGRGNISAVKVNGKVFPFFMKSDFRESPVAVQAYWKGNFYLGANRELFRYSKGTVEKVASFDKQIISLSVDRANNLWVGFFNGGVTKFSRENFESFSSLAELRNNSVTTVLNDREGGYWFSTLDRGVLYFPNLDITVKSFEEGFSKLTVVATGRSMVYTGDYSGDVKAFGPDPDDVKVIHREHFPVSALFEDSHGTVWGSCQANHFTITRDGAFTRYLLPMVTMKGFFAGPAGNTFGFYSTGVYSLEGPAISQIVSLPGRPQAAVFTDSVIYIGTLSGLEVFDRSLKRIPGILAPMKSRIASLYKLPGSRIAVGTIGEGLYIMDKGKPVKVEDVLAANVYTMLVKGNRIWAATEKGLAISPPLQGNLLTGEWHQLKRSSGLLSDKCDALAVLGSNVLVFSDQGISVVPSGISVYSTTQPAAYVKNYEVNNTPVPTIPAKLGTSDNNITFNVGAVSFNNRELYFRHRLNELSEWSYSEGRNISYFALRPGSYKVEIELSTDGKNWSKSSKTILFSIDAPWWGTFAFRGFVLVAILLIGFAIYMMRINAIRRKQTYLELINSHQQRLIDSEIQTQERERKRIAKDLHDGVGTSLSSIKFMISDSVNAASTERDQRVQEINDVLTDVIVEIKRIVYDLHPPALERYGLQVGLKNLAERINNHGGISIMYDYYGHREVSADVSITIYRIIQELINNTIRHAKASEIRIHVNQFEDELNIMYEDNGIGMIGSRFTGLGLHSIESRVRSLQGRMTWESNHKGTFYNFDIPF